MPIKEALKKVFGDPHTKKLKRLNKQVDQINELTDAYKKKSDNALKKEIEKYRKQLQDGEVTTDDILNPVFAITREMAERTLGMRHFDVQMVGGIVLHEGSIAEMRTGEGKTLVATLPIVLNGITGKGTHVVTVNDYLARRDAGWMAQLYNALGLSVGVIMAEASFIYDSEFEDEKHDDERLQHLRPVTRREAYEADVTYGTNNEFGFDYLRDNMVRSKEDLRQRELAFAIVDEVDSILIDEARTPLIISAPASTSSNQYELFSKAVKQLIPEDYEVDEKQRSALLTDKGIEKLQSTLGIDNLYDAKHVQAVYHLDQALRAETLFKRDKDYVVHEGEIIIVDEFTGRLMHGRRYSEGLHQAIEAKEGVLVQQESMTLATISFQNYFRLYDKLSGMTGTAVTEAEEFFTIYGLDVVAIPTNKPVRRDDLPDRIYGSEKGKFNSIVQEIKQLQEKGQPVLVGTVSVEKNEILSHLLQKAGVKHEVLNAKNNEREAAIVAEAGKQRSVTLATNIAGRGTDIVLGEGVVEKGGLHVLGTERHESRRIDNQLRGRAGRQGDPGSTQFYVSAEDDLMRIFGGDRMKNLMERLGVDEETPIENKTITKSLENAQKKVEDRNFDSRKHVVQYDDVMNRHRKATYTLRKEILHQEDISDKIQNLIDEEIEFISKRPDLEVKEIVDEYASLIPVEEKDKKKLYQTDEEELTEVLKKHAHKLYTDREKAFGKELVQMLEREVYLRILDDLWMQHLENMQHLREGINWRSVGQKDPLVEYRREGQIFFEEMQGELRLGVLRLLYRAEPRQQEPSAEAEMETELTKAAQSAQTSGSEPTSKTQKKRAKQNKPANSGPRGTSGGKKRKNKKKERKNRKKGRR